MAAKKRKEIKAKSFSDLTNQVEEMGSAEAALDILEALRKRDIDSAASLLNEMSTGIDRVNADLVKAAELIDRARSKLSHSKKYPKEFVVGFTGMLMGVKAFAQIASKETTVLSQRLRATERDLLKE